MCDNKLIDTNFSDISFGSIQQDQFDNQRILLSGPINQQPFNKLSQKTTRINIETNCDSKQEIFCYGDFVKQLDRFSQKLSYEKQQYDIYNSKELYYAETKLIPLKTNKQLSKKYVMNFKKNKSNKKSINQSKSQSSSKKSSFKKIDKQNFYQKKRPLEQYFTPRICVPFSKKIISNKQKILKHSLSKSSKQKNSISKRKQKISLSKRNPIQKHKTISFFQFK